MLGNNANQQVKLIDNCHVIQRQLTYMILYINKKICSLRLMFNNL